MRNWQASRANATLHNWHVKEFLLITQCDLLNAVDDCFGLLQVYTRNKYNQILINHLFQYFTRNLITKCFCPLTFQLSDHDETVNMTKSMSIRFYVHLQTNLAKQVRECQEAIKVRMFLII